MPDRQQFCAAGGSGHAGPAQIGLFLGLPLVLAPAGLIGDSAAVAGGYLTAFLRAESMLVQ
jgi:hypothetical protein